MFDVLSFFLFNYTCFFKPRYLSNRLRLSISKIRIRNQDVDIAFTLTETF